MRAGIITRRGHVWNSIASLDVCMKNAIRIFDNQYPGETSFLFTMWNLVLYVFTTDMSDELTQQN